MFKIRIVFNRYNIDALCATSMVVNAFRMDFRKHLIETIPYSPTDYNPPTHSQGSDYTFMIGTNAEMHENLQEFTRTANFIFINSGENTDGEEIFKLTQGSTLVFMPHFFNGKRLDESIEVAYSKNLSKLTRLALKSIITYKDEECNISTPLVNNLNDGGELLEVIDAVESYCQFQNVGAKAIAIVDKNYDNIIQSAFSGAAIKYYGLESIKDLLLEDPKNSGNYLFKENLSRIIKARYFIQAGMANQLYRDQKNSMMVQTIQIVEEYLYDIIRLASYPYDTVVTYQDTKHHRQWWICCKDKIKLDKLLSLIPHQKMLLDGNIVHLISDIPKLSQ